jgi:hypothetical protein
MPSLDLTLAPFDSVRAEVPIATPTGALLRVFRTSPSGTQAAVRGYDPFVVPDGTTVLAVRDYEAPLGVPLAYTAQVDGEPDVYTGSITIPATATDDPWLVDLVRPTNSQRVAVQALPELAYDAPSGVHWILNRRSPIFTGSVAHTPSFALAFVTATEDDRQRARANLGNGAPCLLRTPPEQGVGNLYFAVPSWSEQRVSRLALHPDRRFVASGIQVDRPDPALYVPLAPNVYGVVLEVGTYADVEARWPTYDAMLWDYTTLEGPADIQPWPPTDV